MANVEPIPSRPEDFELLASAEAALRWFEKLESTPLAELRQAMIDDTSLVSRLRTAVDAKKAAGPMIGATGEGACSAIPGDEGGLQVALSVQGNLVKLEFGKPVAWLSMSRGEALQMATLLAHAAAKPYVLTEPSPPAATSGDAN